MPEFVCELIVSLDGFVGSQRLPALRFSRKQALSRPLQGCQTWALTYSRPGSWMGVSCFWNID